MGRGMTSRVGFFNSPLKGGSPQGPFAIGPCKFAAVIRANASPYDFSRPAFSFSQWVKGSW